jgi:hypothetical protein
LPKPFGALLAQAVELLALGRRQAAGRGFDRGRIVRRWRCSGEALAPRRMTELRPSAINGSLPAAGQASTLAALK